MQSEGMVVEEITRVELDHMTEEELIVYLRINVFRGYHDEADLPAKLPMAPGVPGSRRLPAQKLQQRTRAEEAGDVG